MNHRAIEAVARALREAEVGYHLSLTRLVDGVSTYTLTYNDGSPFIEFDNMDDGYAHISAKRSEAQSKAVITAYEAHLKAEGFVVVPREPTQAMTQAAMDALDSPFYADLERVYRAMIAAAQEHSDV